MLETPHDPAASRYEHAAHGLRRRDLDPDPIKQFSNWFTAAIEAGIRDINAMIIKLAKSSLRVFSLALLATLLQGNAGQMIASAQSTSINQSSKDGTFTWTWSTSDNGLRTKVRINGKVEKTSREESARYFHSRPVGSQLGAWASRQTEVLDARRVLDARMAEMTERFADKPIPLPPHWGGYRLIPDTMEFWQGRPDRLHDRFRYTRQADSSWLIDRLAP